MSTRTVTDRVRRCDGFLVCVLLAAARSLPAGGPETGSASERSVIARTEYRIEAVPGEITWTATTRLDITGPGLEHLTASVPPELQIIGVSGEGLAGWKSASTRGRRPKQTLELQFGEPLSGGREIVLTGVMTHAADEPWSVPPLVLHSVDAHVGRAQLVSAECCHLALEDLDGARPVIDGSGAGGFVFDLWQEDFRLEFTTRQKDQALRADLLTRINVGSDRIGLTASAEVQPLDAPPFELRLEVSSGWQVSQVRLDERLVPWHVLTERDGVCELRIPLAEPVTPGRTARLELRAALPVLETEQEFCEIPLPAVALPQATRVRGRYVIDRSAGDKMELTHVSGLRPATEHESGDGLCYEHDARPIAGTLRITPRSSGPGVPVAAAEESTATEHAQPLPLPATVVRHVHTSSKLDAAGRARHRADYLVGADVCSLLIRLPNSATLWQVHAGEQRLPVRQDGEVLEARLVRPDTGSTSRTVSIVYHEEHTPLEASGMLELRPIAVRAIDQHGRERDLEVLERHWSVQPPAGIVLYESHGAFHAVDRLVSSGWVAAIAKGATSAAGAIWAGLFLAAGAALTRLRVRWRIMAAAALVIAAAGLFVSVRPVPGSAASQLGPLHGIAKSGPAGILFRATLPDDDTALGVRYMTDIHATAARCAAAACTVFVLWLLRRRGPTFRALLAAAGLAGPVAALPFVDGAQHVWLDGIALGTLAAALLWQVRPFTVPRFKASAVLSRSAAALMVVAIVGGTARCDERILAAHVESALDVWIADEGVYLQGRYDVRALSGPLGELSFSLPEDVKIRSVTGRNAAGWHVQRDTEPGRLVVRFDRPSAESTKLAIELFQPMSFPEGITPWELPLVHPLNLASHRGTISVRAADHLAHVISSTGGLRRIDQATANCAAKPSLIWALTGGDAALALEITRHSHQPDVLAVHSAVVEPERLRLSSRFRVRHHGAPSLRFTAFVPEGYRAADVRAPHLARWSLDEGLLTVWFDRPQSGTADIELDLAAALQPDAQGVEIAVPLPLEAARVRSLLGVEVDDALVPSVDADALSGWTSAAGTADASHLDAPDRGRAPLLLLANDSPEPLPVFVGLTRNAPLAEAQSMAAELPAEAHLEKATPDAIVETARLNIGLRSDGTLRIEARYHVSNRARRLLPVLIPAGMRLLSAEVDGRAVPPVQVADEEPASVLIPLAGCAQGQPEARLLLAAQLPDALPTGSRSFERQRLELPVPQVPSTEMDSQHGLPAVRTICNISVPSALRASAPFGEARSDRLTIEQSGSPASLRLSIAPASPVHPASLLAAAALAIGAWGIVRRPRTQPSLAASSPARAPEPPTIAALPHQSGIFSATDRAIEPGRGPGPR